MNPFLTKLKIVSLKFVDTRANKDHVKYRKYRILFIVLFWFSMNLLSTSVDLIWTLHRAKILQPLRWNRNTESKHKLLNKNFHIAKNAVLDQHDIIIISQISYLHLLTFYLLKLIIIFVLQNVFSLFLPTIRTLDWMS